MKSTQKRQGRFFGILAAGLVFAGIFFPRAGRAELQLPGMVSTRSISGEFAIIGADQISPLADTLAVKTNTDLVQLQPALLAVSAENIKNSIYQRLGINDSVSHGQIILALHPAQSLDEDVTIVSSRFNNAWIYRVELPDVITRERVTQALASVVLLEFANRKAGDHSAEIPEWLVQGLSEQLLESFSPGIVSITPGDTINGYSEDRMVDNDFGLTPLARAREIFKSGPPLTVEQLNWPTEAQLNGMDGGVYQASAELFVGNLLDLQKGAADLRAMLQALPGFYNWQLAFRAAFRTEFPSPLDLEKWWALQTVDFVSRDAGPQWSAEVSRQKMDEILAVPMDFRSSSNNLPLRAEISLQRVIGNIDPQQQEQILQEKVRELELAQLQMAPQFAVLNDQYRQVLADYLDENPPTGASHWIKHLPTRPGAGKTIRKLDALDAQRRAQETALDEAPQPALTERSPQL